MSVVIFVPSKEISYTLPDMTKTRDFFGKTIKFFENLNKIKFNFDILSLCFNFEHDF